MFVRSVLELGVTDVFRVVAILSLLKGDQIKKKKILNAGNAFDTKPINKIITYYIRTSSLSYHTSKSPNRRIKLPHRYGKKEKEKDLQIYRRQSWRKGGIHVQTSYLNAKYLLLSFF